MAQFIATVERERESHTLVTKKSRGFNLARNGGITLIGLVITIVIMLILTGITINLLFGDNGIITKTKMAKKAFLGEDAREVVEDRVNAYIAEYGSKGELDLFDFWAMYNSSELLDASGNSTGQANLNYDENFVIYLFEDVGVAFTPTIQAYTKKDTYTSAVVIYKGYQATVNKNLTVAKTVREVTKLEDISPDLAHELENEVPGASKWKNGIQTPQLSEGMVPVTWDTTASKWKICSASDNNWYNYIDTSASGQTDKSQWANVMLMDGLTVYPEEASTTGTPVAVDNSNVSSKIGHYVANEGSMFVWIPRYEYKIVPDSGSVGSSPSGSILVNFISTETTSETTGYAKVSSTAKVNGYTVPTGTVYNTSTDFIIHPAFINEYSNDEDDTNDFLNGGWDSELPGIWVAKFEASNSKGEEYNGTDRVVKVVPGVSSWGSITIANMFTCCRNITGSNAEIYGFTSDTDTIVDEENQTTGTGKTYAHLMKNSEWGAVAYLTHSKYGRNGVEICINPNSNYVTGIGSSSPTASATTSTDDSYTTTNGMKASTTGNVYGIYDMSGGMWEAVTGFRYGENGSIFAANGKSTKYATWYVSEDENAKVGDAIYETKGWNSDFSVYANSNLSFILRSGSKNNGAKAGIFCYARDNGGVAESSNNKRLPPSACSRITL